LSERTNLQTETQESVYQQELVTAFRSDSLHLILLPTERCNFRCAYCYEDFAIGRMRPETVLAIKRLIDRRLEDLQSLSVSWFGGEPMLARPVVEDISEHIVQVRAARPNPFQYVADMTTNGYLLDSAKAERLGFLGIRHFQISLDGPEPLHDRTRLRADGKGTFSKIWDNLLGIRDGTAPVNILIRVHLTPNNLPSMPDFLAKVRETFLWDPRFKVLLKAVEHLGGPNDATMEILPMDAQAQIIRELEKVVLDGVDTDSLFSTPEICYAARPNSLAIRADGRIGKCTVALADERNTIGQLLPDGSLKIDQSRLRPWLHGWASGDLEALACPYSSFLDPDGTDPAPGS
jgi:uncharacterized protein